MPKFGIDKEAKELLFNLLTKLEKDDFIDFFQSILSSAEIKDISRRIMAVKFLFEKHTFTEIEDLMGMSSGTINKIYFKTKGSPVLNKLLKKD